MSEKNGQPRREGREYSRASWWWKTDGQGLVSANINEDAARIIEIGCLQRIADALERIADLMDPRTEQRIEAGVSSRSNLKSWELDDYGDNRMVRRKIADYFKSATPTEKEREMFTRIARQVIQSCYPTVWDKRYDRPATTEEQNEVRRKIREFDPATFDWTVIRLGPIMRTRLDQLVARRKSLAAT